MFLIPEPSSAPENFKCNSESPTEILLEWGSLNASHWRGFAKGYFIEYFVYDNNGNVRYNISVTSSDTSVTLGRLKQFTNYRISIAAETGAGRGSRAACVQKTQEGGMLKF